MHLHKVCPCVFVSPYCYITELLNYHCFSVCAHESVYAEMCTFLLMTLCLNGCVFYYAAIQLNYCMDAESMVINECLETHSFTHVQNMPAYHF